ncbi:MAG TPA: SDR family NAD(P)-dependent oxidoreductase [Steroidobacteraceae bacterium]|nr:SDR family NAD(P)-dependent oxidoreductase [Steroidobacteraceae bacterium]
MSEPSTVVVTGAFGALGGAVARRFASRGVRLGLLGRGPVPAALRQEFGAAHVLLGGVDLTVQEAASAAMQSVAAATGGFQVLVNVAGAFRWETLAEGDVSTWELMFAMNLKTAVVASKAALPHLIAAGGGRIVNIGAGAAGRAAAGMGAYAASKAGVERLTEALAAELRDRNVTVNAILPGTIDTAANRAAMPDADVARWVEPEAVADVVVFLASDAARAVTGAALRVFGRG